MTALKRIILYFFQPNPRGVNHNTIGRTIVFTCGVYNAFPTVYMCSICSCVNENIACYALRKQSTQTTYPHCVYFVGDFTCLEKEPKDFSSCVFPSGLLVVHDASWGCQNNESADNKTKTKNNITRLSKMVLPFE